MESVINCCFKLLAFYTGGGKETGDSLHFCSCRNLQILALLAHGLRWPNKSLSCITQPLSKLLFLCYVLGSFILLICGSLWVGTWFSSNLQVPWHQAYWFLKLPELKSASFQSQTLRGIVFLVCVSSTSGALCGVWVSHFSVVVMSLLFVFSHTESLVPKCLSAPLTPFNVAFSLWLAVECLFC